VSGAARNEGDADFTRQAAVSVGHVHRRGFMPDVNEIDAGIERGIKDRHDVVAGQREHPPAAETVKRTSNNLSAAQGVAHRLFGIRGERDERAGRVSAPHFVGNLHRRPQLRPLLILGEHVAFLG
jgi:hypothetical protein